MSKPAKILLYTVPWCPHCVRIKEFLDSLRAEYQNFDVDDDNARWHEALAITEGEDIVPVISVNGKSRFGAFDSAFEQWLRKNISVKK